MLDQSVLMTSPEHPVCKFPRCRSHHWPRCRSYAGMRIAHSLITFYEYRNDCMILVALSPAFPSSSRVTDGNFRFDA